MDNVIGVIMVMAALIGGAAVILYGINRTNEDNRRQDQICYPLAKSGVYIDRLTHKERVVCALPDGGVEVK